ncbi:MAG: hypothetical protein ABEI97_00515 [Candidatus Nanohaloarchaea archaeon]
MIVMSEYGEPEIMDFGAINPAAKLGDGFPEQYPTTTRLDSEYGTIVFDRGGFYEQVREYAERKAGMAEEIEVSATDDDVFTAFLYNTEVAGPTGDDVSVLPQIYTDNAEVVEEMMTVLRSAVASVARDNALRFMDPLEDRDVGLLIETRLDPEERSLTAVPRTYELPSEEDLWEDHYLAGGEEQDAALEPEQPTDRATAGEDGGEPLFDDPRSRDTDWETFPWDN